MKITGRMVVIQLTDREARLLEGIAKGDHIEIISALHLKNLSGFFEAGRISNLTGLIDHLCMSMRTASFKTNRVMLCCGLELDARLELETVQQEEKKWAALLKPPSVSSIKSGIRDDRVRDRHVWGSVADAGEVRAAVSYLEADAFFVAALKDEFASYGFTLLGMDTPDLAVLNLTRIVPYSYDTPDKLLLQVFRRKIHCTAMVRDVPVSLSKVVDRDETQILKEQIRDLCQREIRTRKLSHPHVLIVGPDISTFEYSEIHDYLVGDGINTYDMREVFVGISEPTDDPTDSIGPAFGTCFAALLKCFDKSPVNLLPKRQKIEIITPQRLKFWSKAVLAGAAMCFVGGLILCIPTGVGMIQQISEARQTDALGQQIAALQAEKERAASDKQMLDLCSPFISNAFSVINDYSAGRLAQRDFAIASIDTGDMLPQTTVNSISSSGKSDTLLQKVLEEESTGDTVADTPQDTETDSEAQQEMPAATQPAANGQAVRANATLYVRGYATKPELPFNFYNALSVQHAGNVRITGVEQVEIAQAAKVWVFEIEIRGGEV